ncbi:MAG: hypothetical protein AB2A00_21605 [Myxococcota bacterium]
MAVLSLACGRGGYRDPCLSDEVCDHGLHCAVDAGGVCTRPCVSHEDCPAGFPVEAPAECAGGYCR